MKSIAASAKRIAVKSITLIAAFLVTGLKATAFPSTLTVKLFASLPAPHTVMVDGPFKILNLSGRTLPAARYQLAYTKHSITLRSNSQKSSLCIEAPLFALKGTSRNGLPITVEHRRIRHYQGTVVFFLTKSKHASQTAPGISMKNIVSARDYIYSVVGSESLPSFAPEALKAQAVLTMTRVARLKQDTEFGDSTQDECYLGSDAQRPPVKQAVNAVWGEVLTYKGTTIKPYYHSTCAGKTSSAVDVFGEAARGLTYLRCTKCNYCKQSPFFKTTTCTIARQQFEKVFGNELPVVRKIDCAGRPARISILENGRAQELTGYRFWIQVGQHFGWDKMPGTRFKISEGGHGTVQVESTGAGHGVGLCQWGADGMARQGKKYWEILRFYLPGTGLNKML